MKTIIFVRDMKTEDQADRIRVALEDTRVEYKVALESGAVVIEGSNDLVYAAKTAIREAGFTSSIENKKQSAEDALFFWLDRSSASPLFSQKSAHLAVKK